MNFRGDPRGLIFLSNAERFTLANPADAVLDAFSGFHPATKPHGSRMNGVIGKRTWRNAEYGAGATRDAWRFTAREYSETPDLSCSGYSFYLTKRTPIGNGPLLAPAGGDMSDPSV